MVLKIRTALGVKEELYTREKNVKSLITKMVLYTVFISILRVHAKYHRYFCLSCSPLPFLSSISIYREGCERVTHPNVDYLESSRTWTCAM